MRIIELLYVVLFLSLGLITSITDFREGKIYNKTLVSFLIIGILLNTIYYGYFAQDLIGIFFANFIVASIISLLLFYTHAIAGGDCKLILVLLLLYPANYYIVYGNSNITLFFSLGISIFYAYIYMFVSSSYKLINKKQSLTKNYIKKYMILFFKTYISIMSYVLLVNILLQVFSDDKILVNQWIIRIFCISVSWLVGKYKMMQKLYLVILIFVVDFVVGYYCKIMPMFKLENYILVIFIMLCQLIIKTNLYEEINISELRKGMILSMTTSIAMQNSRVRGLPQVSMEDLRSRITEDEVNSIKRWAKSRNVNSLTIVKKMPFAMFIFMGFVSYYIIWSVL